MVSFKGRLGIKQFISNKPVRFGIKPRSATGCCCKFDIYLGKSKEANDLLALGKSAALVMNLAKGLVNKNYDVYMDYYYTSVPLFLALPQDKRNWCMWHNTSKSQVLPEGCSC